MVTQLLQRNGYILDKINAWMFVLETTDITLLKPNTNIWSQISVTSLYNKSFYIVNPKATCHIKRQACINARASVRHPIQTVKQAALFVRDKSFLIKFENRRRDVISLNQPQGIFADIPRGWFKLMTSRLLFSSLYNMIFLLSSGPEVSGIRSQVFPGAFRCFYHFSFFHSVVGAGASPSKFG